MTDKIATTEQLIIEQLLAKPDVPRDISPESKIVEDLALTASLS